MTAHTATQCSFVLARGAGIPARGALDLDFGPLELGQSAYAEKLPAMSLMRDCGWRKEGKKLRHTSLSGMGMGNLGKDALTYCSSQLPKSQDLGQEPEAETYRLQWQAQLSQRNSTSADGCLSTLGLIDCATHWIPLYHVVRVRLN